MHEPVPLRLQILPMARSVIKHKDDYFSLPSFYWFLFLGCVIFLTFLRLGYLIFLQNFEVCRPRCVVNSCSSRIITVSLPLMKQLS